MRLEYFIRQTHDCATRYVFARKCQCRRPPVHASRRWRQHQIDRRLRWSTASVASEDAPLSIFLSKLIVNTDLMAPPTSLEAAATAFCPCLQSGKLRTVVSVMVKKNRSSDCEAAGESRRAADLDTAALSLWRFCSHSFFVHGGPSLSLGPRGIRGMERSADSSDALDVLAMQWRRITLASCVNFSEAVAKEKVCGLLKRQDVH